MNTNYTNQYYGKVASVEERWTDLESHLSEVNYPSKESESVNILDIGCAEGEITKLITNYFYKRFSVCNSVCTLGIELEKDKFEKASEKAIKTSLYALNFEYGDICTKPQEFFNEFNYIFALGILHKLSTDDNISVANKIIRSTATTVVFRVSYSYINSSYNILEALSNKRSVQIYEGNKGQGYIMIFNKC